MYNYIYYIGLSRFRKNYFDPKDVSSAKSEKCHDNIYCIIIGSTLVSGYIYVLISC